MKPLSRDCEHGFKMEHHKENVCSRTYNRDMTDSVTEDFTELRIRTSHRGRGEQPIETNGDISCSKHEQL